MKCLDLSENICNLTIKNEYIWGKEAVRQAKKCLILIQGLRQSENKNESECIHTILHDMAILASLHAKHCK